jgi:hypothetical protein
MTEALSPMGLKSLEFIRAESFSTPGIRLAVLIDGVYRGSQGGDLPG